MLVGPSVGWSPYHFENWLSRDCFEKRRRKRKSVDVENWLHRNCFAPGNGCPFFFKINFYDFFSNFFIQNIMGREEEWGEWDASRPLELHTSSGGGQAGNKLHEILKRTPPAPNNCWWPLVATGTFRVTLYNVKNKGIA
jgi:hypothetical protein